MTTQVTQCPECHTSFRVTDAQLTIANGAVRCGSCLHIFHAPDYWLESHPGPLPATETPSVPPAQMTSDPAIEDPFHEQQFVVDESSEQHSLDSIFEDGNFDDDNYLDQLTDHLADSSPQWDHQTVGEEPTIAGMEASTENTGSEHAPTSQNDEDLVNLDDYLLDDDPIIDDNLLIGDTRAQSIINIEDDLNEIENTQSTADSEFSPYFLDLDQQETRPAAVFNELDDIDDNDDTEDEEGWALKLLAEAEEDEQDSTAIASKKPPFNSTPAEDKVENLFDTLEEEEHQPAQLDPELLDILNDSEQSAAPQDEFMLGDPSLFAEQPIGGNDNHALLANIEPEPLELATGPEGSRWRQRAWLAGVIAALLLLAVQYLVFNFDRLARDNNYRPLLATSCAVLGCSMPALHDLSLIRSSNLMVRSHPIKTGALVVDAIMTNHAEFKQAFPVMELQFNDLEGQTVAGRRFTPQEYLAGELLGRSTMPTRQPIHIALEIVDPGDQAVNYELRFHASSPR